MPAATLTYVYLFAAILCEIAGTTFLQKSRQFTLIMPTVLMAVFYLAAFYLLSLTLRQIPVGIAYAIWSGLGIVLISGVGVVLFGQKLDFAAIAGLAMIVAGVVVINVFSNSATH